MRKWLAAGVTVLLAAAFLLHLLFLSHPAPVTRGITLTARKFAYEPNIISVNKGDRLRITLTPEDVEHGFFLDGYNIESHARPGRVSTVDFEAGISGKFPFRCSVTCGAFHPYMMGWLKVGPNYPFIVSIWMVALLGWLTLAYALHRGGMLR